MNIFWEFYYFETGYNPSIVVINYKSVNWINSKNYLSTIFAFII